MIRRRRTLNIQYSIVNIQLFFPDHPPGAHFTGASALARRVVFISLGQPIKKIG